jgi:hypothetical protein
MSVGCRLTWGVTKSVPHRWREASRGAAGLAKGPSPARRGMGARPAGIVGSWIGRCRLRVPVGNQLAHGLVRFQIGLQGSDRPGEGELRSPLGLMGDETVDADENRLCPGPWRLRPPGWIEQQRFLDAARSASTSPPASAGLELFGTRLPEIPSAGRAPGMRQTRWRAAGGLSLGRADLSRSGHELAEDHRQDPSVLQVSDLYLVVQAGQDTEAEDLAIPTGFDLELLPWS